MIHAFEIFVVIVMALIALGFVLFGFIMLWGSEPDPPRSKSDWRGPFR